MSKIHEGNSCIYIPPLKCKDTKIDKDTISKVSTDYSMDIDISKKLKDYSKYFIVADKTQCKTKLESAKCNNKSVTLTNHLYMKNGGDTLSKYITKNKLSYIDVTNLFIHSIYGLLLLHSLKIYHMDIKPANLVVKDNIIRYIDFGISIFDKYKYDNYKVAYIYWPPEYNLKNTKDYKAVIENYKTDENFNPFLLHKKDPKTMKFDKAKISFELVDIYMLGMVFNYVYNQLDIKKSKKINKLILGMTSLISEDRWDDKKIFLYITLFFKKLNVFQTSKNSSDTFYFEDTKSINEFIKKGKFFSCNLIN